MLVPACREVIALATSFDAFGPLMVEQLRAQVGNLMAAMQLITPALRERGEARYDQYLATMNQSLYRLLRLMNNVEFAALSQDPPMVQEGPLDLAGLCRELSDQVAPLADQAGVAFRYEAECASLLTVGDAALLRRMLLNLIANALRAAGKGGAAGLRLTAAQGRVLLTVWDDGPGITPPLEEDSLTERPEGAGLGLEVARRVASIHGGALVFDQQEGRGGRATVSLPIRTPEGGGTLRSPILRYDGSGGFSPVLVELSGVLPYSAFLPQDLE